LLNRRQLLAALLPPGSAVPRPGPRDLCPVCGMIVAKYPNWIATALWNDNHANFFDGARDLFRFLHALPHYAPKRRPADLRALTVTEFYDLKPIDAKTALYVAGSDVLGPMGNELIPLSSRDDAREFLQDHHGKRILTFPEITPKLVDSLDALK